MTPPRDVPAWVQEIEVSVRDGFGIGYFEGTGHDPAAHLLAALSECVEALRTIQHLHEIIPEGLPDVGFCVSCGTMGPCQAKRLADRVLARYESGEIGR